MGRYTSDRHRETQALQSAVKKLEDKEINLWRAFTEHGMRPQIYEQLAREYEDERQRITAAIDLISKESGEVIDNLDAALAVISEIADRYAEHTPQRQRDILKQMVKRVVIDPEGRIIRMELKPPFNYLDTLAKGGQNGKRGKGSSAGTKKTSTQAGSLHITQSDPALAGIRPIAEDDHRPNPVGVVLGAQARDHIPDRRVQFGTAIGPLSSVWGRLLITRTATRDNPPMRTTSSARVRRNRLNPPRRAFSFLRWRLIVFSFLHGQMITMSGRDIQLSSE
jgi:hypothetical protein